MIWKTFRLVRSEILGLFGNTFTADRTYSRHRWDKLQQQVQTLLSQQWRTFSRIFITFSESKQNFPYFEKKNPLHGLNISEVIDTDIFAYFNARKLRF